MKARGWTAAVVAGILAGCAHTVVMRQPPRRSLAQYGTIGVIDFRTNVDDPSVGRYALREFQARIQSSQDGVRFKELGSEDQLLADADTNHLDADTLREIGQKYGVSAIFIGDLDFSQPSTTIHLSDIASGSGTAQSYLQGNIFSKLLDVKTGASIWSRSGWARKKVADVQVAKEKGVNVDIRRDADPHYDMVPDLVSLVTEDFQPQLVRQRAR